jgi:hypothetical protein
MIDTRFLGCGMLLLAAATAPLTAQTFRIVGIPDTQNYSELFPTIYAAQTQWIADNLEAMDVRYVSHYGDIVQNGSIALNEWAVADMAMATLDATGIPQGVTAGNHDITPNGISGQTYDPANYLSFFGPQRYAGNKWFRGASPTGLSTFQVFVAHGIPFLALHVECDCAVRELAWAQEVLDRHRDKPVIFTTHRYVQDAEAYTAGVPVVPSGRYPDIWYDVEGTYTPDGIRSREVFQWFVQRNPNILLVNCGHFHEEFHQTSTNVAGNPVHEVLADYQDDPNGGNGWLRVMTFDLGNNRIDFETYSTNLLMYDFAGESQFSLPVQFDDYRESRPVAVLQEGNRGYAGTIDTWISQADGNTSYGSATTLVSDDDTNNSIFNDRRGQALVRFEGLVGDPGVGAVPAGAQIVSAFLSLDFVDDIDNPLFDPGFDVHQVLIPWDENSTWNSLGGGLGGSEIGPRLIRLDGDNDPNLDSLRRVDVTAIVQAWVNGAPNHGFAILPKIIGGNDDGIEIASSENGNALLRPRLEIVYESDCGYMEYGVGAAPANTLQLSGLGLPAIGGFLDVQTAPADFPVVTSISLGQSNLPLLGGSILIDLGLVVIEDATLDGQTVLPIPDLPILAGADLYLQSFAFSPGAPAGFAFSNGLRARICR